MGLTTNQWLGLNLNCQFCNGSIFEYEDCPFEMRISGDKIIEFSGMDIFSLWENICLLVSLMVGYRLIAFLILRFRFRDSNR